MKNRLKLIITLLLFGSMTFLYGLYWGTVIDIDSTELTAETFMERTERAYPETNWEICPDDMEIHAFDFEDKAVYISGSGTLIKDTQTITIASGSSMQPFLMPGNRVIVEPYTNQELQVGMVVISEPSYRDYLDLSPSGYVHRIVKIDGDQIYTLGDNNKRCEVWLLSLNQIEWLARGAIF